MNTRNANQAPHHPNDKPPGDTQPPDMADAATARREPVHPDDIGADGEYLGGDTSQKSEKNQPDTPSKAR
jgi:hypothetical protein